jgi:RND family efflux transporter MFP subunit
MTDLTSPFEAGGVVRARTTAMISSRVMAPITHVHVKPGDRVRRGAALIALDARAIEAEKAHAEAATLSASELARAADADARAAESAVVLARASHERIATLQAKRSATPQELDQVVAALASAEAQRAGAQARLAAASAARNAAAAAAEAAAATATYAVLSAPFDGVITERHADPGSMGTPGAPLLVLEDPAAYRLEVQLDESRAAFAAIGQTVSVRLDNPASEQEGWLSGHVVEIARVDPASHAFLVKVDLPGSAAVRSGMFGRARFAGPTRKALAVPAAALIKRGQLTFVYRVDADGRARLRPVSIGLSDQNLAEVLAGLNEGEMVVTNPPPPLTDGARVAGARS